MLICATINSRPAYAGLTQSEQPWDTTITTSHSYPSISGSRLGVVKCCFAWLKVFVNKKSVALHQAQGSKISS